MTTRLGRPLSNARRIRLRRISFFGAVITPSANTGGDVHDGAFVTLMLIGKRWLTIAEMAIYGKNAVPMPTDVSGATGSPQALEMVENTPEPNVVVASFRPGVTTPKSASIPRMPNSPTLVSASCRSVTIDWSVVGQHWFGADWAAGRG